MRMKVWGRGEGGRGLYSSRHLPRIIKVGAKTTTKISLFHSIYLISQWYILSKSCDRQSYERSNTKSYGIINYRILWTWSKTTIKVFANNNFEFLSGNVTVGLMLNYQIFSFQWKGANFYIKTKIIHLCPIWKKNYDLRCHVKSYGKH